MESVLIASPYIENIMLHADPFSNYCVALVVSSQAEIENWAKKEGIEYTDFPSLCSKEQTEKEVIKSLQKVHSAVFI